ncbi:transcription antitermination factor NusB [Anaerospora sp.]|jgi:N utilization substance protein B|uniref:transcription antitermination factor NusB n=1 Tax=Anaerospora sp. TaxID=1960278 RepID=UPI0028A1490F|nr:transcription antitermination factor NusB [Anaerospora sp.]MDF2927846.1 NusB antitermination factor [Anaerospora sp.]
MSRRKAREVAVQALFQLDFNQITTETAMEAVLDEHAGLSEGAKQYAQKLVTGTQQSLGEIDRIIASAATEWKLDRMAAVDRNIARVAIYEMKFGEEQLPPNVAINEAVEVAKTFGSEDSSRFINGILGSLVKKKSQ